MFIKGDIKSGTTDEAVQEQCFLLDSGASVSANFGFLNFQDNLQAQKQRSIQNSGGKTFYFFKIFLC